MDQLEMNINYCRPIRREYSPVQHDISDVSSLVHTSHRSLGPAQRNPVEVILTMSGLLQLLQLHLLRLSEETTVDQGLIVLVLLTHLGTDLLEDQYHGEHGVPDEYSYMIYLFTYLYQHQEEGIYLMIFLLTLTHLEPGMKVLRAEPIPSTQGRLRNWRNQSGISIILCQPIRAHLVPPPVHHLSDVETEQETQRNQVLELLHVNTNLLKVSLHLLIIDHEVAVGDAEEGVEEEVENTVLPDTLEHASPPYDQESEECSRLVC